MIADEKPNEIMNTGKGPIVVEDENSSSTRIRKHLHDADEAMKAFSGGEVEVIDEATSKRLLRTIDFNIMPVRYLLKYQKE